MDGAIRFANIKDKYVYFLRFIGSNNCRIDAEDLIQAESEPPQVPQVSSWGEEALILM